MHAHAMRALSQLVPILVLVAVLMALIVLSCLDASVVEGVHSSVGPASDTSLIGCDPLALVERLARRRILPLEVLPFLVHADQVLHLFLILVLLKRIHVLIQTDVVLVAVHQVHLELVLVALVLRLRVLRWLRVARAGSVVVDPSKAVLSVREALIGGRFHFFVHSFVEGVSGLVCHGLRLQLVHLVSMVVESDALAY